MISRPTKAGTNPMQGVGGGAFLASLVYDNGDAPMGARSKLGKFTSGKLSPEGRPGKAEVAGV